MPRASRLRAAHLSAIATAALALHGACVARTSISLGADALTHDDTDGGDDGDAPRGATTVPPGGPVSHGRELTVDHVGPWAAQGVARGDEVLDVASAPGAELFFRLGSWREQGLTRDAAFLGSDSDLPHLNDPANHGGVLQAETLIDGFTFPAGTVVVQFRDLPTINAQSLPSGEYLFRGCAFRGEGNAAESAHSAGALHLYFHYCALGGDGPNDWQAGGSFLQFLGGSGHRVFRTLIEHVPIAVYTAVGGTDVIESYIDNLAYYYGDGGIDGNPATDDRSRVYGVTTPASLSSLRLLRNRIVIPSPDGAVAPSHDAPNRAVPLTVCVDLGSGSAADAVTGLQVHDNYLAGGAAVINGGGAGSRNVKITGNTITTRFWSNGGQSEPLRNAPSWGSNGNDAANNVWADDYGAGGDGVAPTSSREYPNGDGPRAGQPVF